ncbi:MAG: DNA recombination protein RmuC [Chitinophagales bacterium]
MLSEFVFLLVGIGIGAAMVWLYFRSRLQVPEMLLAEKNTQIDRETAQFRSELTNLKTELLTERSKSEKLLADLVASKNENTNLVQRLAEQRSQLEELQQRFTKEFENLANRILDEKSKKFTEQNELQLRGILDPLKDRIRDFEKRVNETHNESEKERSALKEQLRTLSDLNRRMSEEALNLTRALKGDSKKQGNWGELILEKVLEKSGLVKGREYEVQQSFISEEGARQQPDVILRLPDNKALIIDSKVSLVGYERYSSCDENDEVQRQQFLKEHIQSLRAHIKGLSAKNYHQLYNIGSPDFVLLFIPIEPAFSLAMQHDQEIYNDAFDKNVVLVSPTTLLATLRTIANVWKQEYQNQNSFEIARQGADMYDKFVAFTDDLIKVGKLMDDSKKAYGEAMNKLVDGKGNLIRRAEAMKKLGLKATKNLPQALVDRSSDAAEP